MICAWDKLIRLLPQWLREDVDKLGKDDLQELRLRLDRPPVLQMGNRKLVINGTVRQEDLNYIVNVASRYSPWTADTAAKGYISVDGGHRIGLCGEAVVKNGVMSGLRKIHSINLRVARDFPGISKRILDLSGSMLLIGPPGSGKTTLLRDLLRKISKAGNVAVVDERGELFPDGVFSAGDGIDVLSACPKAQGIEILLRTMGPSWIGVDEITAREDCDALLQALWCGVKVLATAHAMNLQDLQSRPIYHPLLESGLFKEICILRPDKSYYIERFIP